MKYKYDSYFEKQIPYKMSMEELSELEYQTDAHILAYLRYIGIENIAILAYTYSLKNIMKIKFDFIETTICSSEYEKIICRILNDDDKLYNPLLENNSIIHKNHWYSPYKIKYTPIEFDGVIKRMYVTDFCQEVRSGQIELIEYKFNIDGQKHYEYK